MRRFLPQALLESWTIEEKALERGGGLIFSGEETVHPLSPAVHFVRLLSGDDRHGLVSKVKTEAQVAALGGEQQDDAVVFGETAYQVEAGFLTSGVGAAPPAPVKLVAPEQTLEADLLAAFLLDKL